MTLIVARQVLRQGELLLEAMPRGRVDRAELYQDPLLLSGCLGEFHVLWLEAMPMEARVACPDRVQVTLGEEVVFMIHRLLEGNPF